MPDRMKCRYCRLKKALQVGFPVLPELTNYLEEKEVKEEKKAVTVEEPVYVDVESCSPAVKKGVRKGTPVHSPIPVIDPVPFITSSPPLPSTSNNTVYIIYFQSAKNILKNNPFIWKFITDTKCRYGKGNSEKLFKIKY